MSSFKEIMNILDETIEKAEQLEESISTQIADAENRGYKKAYEELESKYQELIYQAETNIRNKAIDDYMNLLLIECIETPNECWNLECPFADDECRIITIAKQLKEQKNDKSI